jgi:thiamine-phosphate pyrophosphorylase
VERGQSCQIYAVVELGPGADERLSAALSAARIACCLIAAPEGEEIDRAAAKVLIGLAQSAGTAALIAADADAAKALGADGVHLTAGNGLDERCAAARALLGRNAIVGADAGLSRHDAMTVAEAGADYIAFGAPRHLHDRPKACARRDALVAWWAEIFQVPCVALDVESAVEAEPLARSGADFVAVSLDAGRTAAAARELIAAIRVAISTKPLAA